MLGDSTLITITTSPRVFWVNRFVSEAEMSRNSKFITMASDNARDLDINNNCVAYLW